MSNAAANDLDVIISQLKGSISLIIHFSPLPSHDFLSAKSLCVTIDTHAHIPPREKCMCIYTHTCMRMHMHTEVYSRC